VVVANTMQPNAMTADDSGPSDMTQEPTWGAPCCLDFEGERHLLEHTRAHFPGDLQRLGQKVPSGYQKREWVVLG
jgi:hypothetical protein